MSDSPEKKNPWAKHLAKQGATPLPTADPAALPTAVPARDPAVRPGTSPIAKSNPWAKSLGKQPVARPAAGGPAPSVLQRAPVAPAPASISPTERPVRTPVAPPMAKSSPDNPVGIFPSTTAKTPAGVRSGPGSKKEKASPSRGAVVSDEMAAALAALAAEYAPLPVSTAPFISVKERELEAKQFRRRRRNWLLKRGAGLILGLALLLAFVSVALFRAPSDEALAAATEQAAQAIVPLYSSRDLPLTIDRAEAVLSDEFDSGHRRYFAEITLRLREALYGPASTNGAVSYQMMQESVRGAREKQISLGLFPDNDGPKIPELPRLIQVVHLAGEPLLVRVPFIARKFIWKWRLEPPQIAKRSANRHFEGLPRDHFNDEPSIVFGIPETMQDIRTRTNAAREYVIAIGKEIQRRSAGGSANDALAAEPAGSAAGLAAPESSPVIDPDKPAVTPEQPAKPRKPPR